MKKKFTLILIALVTAFVLYAVFVTKVFSKTILIAKPLSLVTKQVSETANVAKWYLPFASADTTDLNITNSKIEYNSSSISIVRHVDLSVWFDVNENKNKQAVVFSVFADTGNVSKIVLSYQTTLWNKFFGSSIIKNAEESLDNLKEYFADSKKMYGYEIEMTSLSDTAFLFSSKVVARKTKKEAFTNLFESLIKYADEKKLGYTGLRIFYTSPYGNDSIHLFTSIGIVNTADVPLDGTFSLKKMPYLGHLLTAYYQGSFNNVNQAIDALGQFKTDNNITSMAIPFVKLISEGISFDDKQVIQAKACYPVN
jgi:hypothetical protein